jgi:hypothetical protein
MAFILLLLGRCLSCVVFAALVGKEWGKVQLLQNAGNMIRILVYRNGRRPVTGTWRAVLFIPLRHERTPCG